MFKERNIFTNVYGLARSLIALCTLINILFTPLDIQFGEDEFNNVNASDLLIPNIYLLLGYENALISNFICTLILIIVITGYLPQLTGIFHAIVAYSFVSATKVVEGGDQLAQIITILLIPITLFDKRINHWSFKEFFTYKRGIFISYICFTFYVVIQIQVAVVYLFAAVGKLATHEWTDGSAYYYWFNSSVFGGSQLLHYFLDFFINDKFFSPLITWGTLLLELMLFASIFSKDFSLKRNLFFIALLFHFGIIIVHGLISFFFSMAGALVFLLIPSDEYINLNKSFKKYSRFIRQKARNKMLA